MALGVELSEWPNCCLPMNTKKRYPLIVRAAGRRLYAADGKEYLDGASGGVGAVNIGHAVPEVLEAIAEQSRKVCHANCSLFANEPQIQLAELIVEQFAPKGMEKVYFVTTGTEATELCIKFSRIYHLLRGKPERSKIISRWGGYHGSSLAALSYGGRSTRRRQFHPYFFPVTHISCAYHFRVGRGMSEEEYSRKAADELEDIIRREGPDTVSCFIAEAFVNTMGACPAPAGYFERIREICDRYDVILALDEVVTGFGRTGRNFGIDHWNVCPDVIACGKGISGGYAPLGCAIVSKKIWQALQMNVSGDTVVGYTHSGNPLSTATSLAVLKYILRNDLVSRCARVGERMMKQARERLDNHPHVGDIRGKGLHIAIEFVKDRQSLDMYPPDVNKSEEVYERCMSNGLNLCPVHGDSDGMQGDSIIIKPAFTILDEEVDELLDKLQKSLEDTHW
jgi:adenosylmethionine-8-amino-7-oxononanoate aminotransferase